MLEMNDYLYKKYDTIIFDLDGTLLDTIEDLADSVNFALASEGFSKHTLSEIQSFVGNGSAKLIERAVPDGTSEEIKEKTLACFKRYYADNCENKTKPYEGIYDLLDWLTEKGFKIAVVSNKSILLFVHYVRDILGQGFNFVSAIEKESNGSLLPMRFLR